MSLQSQYVILGLATDKLVPLEAYKSKLTLQHQHGPVDYGDLELVDVLQWGACGVKDTSLLVGQVLAIWANDADTAILLPFKLEETVLGAVGGKKFVNRELQQ